MDIVDKIRESIIRSNRLKEMDMILDVPLHLIRVSDDPSGDLYIIERVGNTRFTKISEEA